MGEDIHKWTDGRYVLMFDEHTFFVWDNEKDKRMTALQVTKKMNEQQSTINKQDKEIAELDQECAEFLGDNIKAFEEFEECTDKLKAKILEQQATINKLKEEEKLYAQEILRLNTLLKQYQANQDLGGGY